MKKLKLQVQMSVDGFVGGTNGELDFMQWVWNDKLKKFVNDLTDTADTILLGRKMTAEFVEHWTNVVKNKPGDESYPLAKRMVDYRKVVFTKTLDKSNWENTTLAKGELSEEITKLKAQPGKDIMVYGGAGFVSSLIKENVIDEYYLFVNPSAIGKGLSIFENIDTIKRLKLVESISFDCGVGLLKYIPA